MVNEWLSLWFKPFFLQWIKTAPISLPTEVLDITMATWRVVAYCLALNPINDKPKSSSPARISLFVVVNPHSGKFFSYWFFRESRKEEEWDAGKEAGGREREREGGKHIYWLPPSLIPIRGRDQTCKPSTCLHQESKIFIFKYGAKRLHDLSVHGPML